MAATLRSCTERRHRATDNISYNFVENPVHVNDLNATILRCMGIDHSRFTFKFQGLDRLPPTRDAD